MLAIVQFSAARAAGLADLARGLPLLLEAHLAGADFAARSVLLRLRESASGSGPLEIDSPVSSDLIAAATAALRPDYVLTAHLASAGETLLALEATLYAMPGPTNVYSRRFEGRRADLPAHLSALALDLRDIVKARPDPLGPDPGDLGTESSDAIAAYCRALLLPADSAERRRALEEALRHDPAYPDAAIALARETLRLRRGGEALDILRRSDESGRRVDPRVIRLRGLVHETLGDPAGALAAYQRLKAARPDSAAADFHVGCALVSLRRFAEAEPPLSRYAAAHPERIEGHENLGVARLARGDLAGAIEAFRRGLAVRPDSASLLSKLGSALAEKGDAAGARAAFEEGLRTAAPYAPLYFNYALLLAPTDPARAIEMYERALEIDPANAAVLTNLGALRVKRLEYEAAAACWRKTIDVAPAGSPAAKLASENLERLEDPAFKESLEATALSSLYAEARAVGLGPAIRKMTEMTEKRPDSWYAFFLLGMALRENHDLDEALAAYARALELKPGQPDALTETSVILGHLGRLDASLEASRRAVAAAPDSAAIVCNLGVALLRLSRFDEAAAEFERARAIAPDDPIIANCFEALELGRAGKDVRFI